MKRLYCFLVILLLSISSYAASITVTWTFPTNNVDGTPLTDLAGAKVYWGTSSSNYTYLVDVGLTNRYTVTNLAEGITYYLNGTAYNLEGLESDFTVEASEQASLPPNKPLEFKFLGP